MPAFSWDAVESRLDTRDSRRKGIVWSSVAAVVIMAVSGVLFFNAPVTEMNDLKLSSNENSNEQPKGNKIAQAENSSAVRTDRHNKEVLQLSSTNSLEGRISKTPEVEQPSIASTSGGVLEDVSLFEIEKSKDYELINKKLGSFSQGYWKLRPSEVVIDKRVNRNRIVSPWSFEVGYDQNQTQFNYTLASSKEKYVHKNYLNRMQEGEFSLSAPQLHTALRLDFNQHWHASLGFGFAQTRTSQRFNFRDSVPVSIAQGQESDIFGNYPIFGYAGLGKQVDYEGTQTVNMISIPFNVGYNHPINRLWSLTAEGSARYNFISGSAGKTLNYHTLELMDANEQVYRNSIVTARLSAGVERRLSIRKWFGLRLNTQGSLTPFFKQEAAVQNRGWSVGLSAYYYWKLF